MLWPKARQVGRLDICHGTELGAGDEYKITKLSLFEVLSTVSGKLYLYFCKKANRSNIWWGADESTEMKIDLSLNKTTLFASNRSLKSISYQQQVTLEILPPPVSLSKKHTKNSVGFLKSLEWKTKKKCWWKVERMARHTGRKTSAQMRKNRTNNQELKICLQIPVQKFQFVIHKSRRRKRRKLLSVKSENDNFDKTKVGTAFEQREKSFLFSTSGRMLDPAGRPSGQGMPCSRHEVHVFGAPDSLACDEHRKKEEKWNYKKAATKQFQTERRGFLSHIYLLLRLLPEPREAKKREVSGR